jgi:DNA-binding cell septation regulator SpoVG
METTSFIASNWKPFQKGAMRGSFSVRLPSGLIIRDIALFEKGASRWIAMPRQRFTNKEGQESFAPIIEFRDSKTADAFRHQAVEALDALLSRQNVSAA